ncbi:MULTISPECIES: heavy-metal-associated domain-containing protein [unclassified Microbacterium]|uniref:heavy-metal-associated domain-containing protein n=1 Tax=unclassified Microbacterium TaxID=2609290 RepID=UPI0038635505
MTTTLIPVTGMTCEHCVRSVTEALSDLPDVSSVVVSLDKAQAVVEHADAFDDVRARAAIREVGYDVGP